MRMSEESAGRGTRNVTRFVEKSANRELPSARPLTDVARFWRGQIQWFRDPYRLAGFEGVRNG